ncbi:16S/23S rRNA (cytidine-2'-O)-methyltransferase [Arthrobacter sp. MYb229]|uniref:TlyA family RNA methyltransferase n=1 Tax=unclassified Arthrobacter TaxID=235627 RepID=UPI000CFC4B48|nr:MULTISPECIES: TlyA family RNA methyltransferase [unclassified Arthrobacter]PQZ99931.1 16S/23S rRNA (cytidine-2'-O)-methyltransferase [Arthrobacter sp. MYb229]PRB48393.1 16S/23S rRNA (cytidine-2'-O)-methyltransferase [Arthrobacter sp. MYb216]
MNRLDQELVSRSLARSRTEAAKLIEAHRVLLDGVCVTKAAKKIPTTARLEVLASIGEEYVSRAGHKLAGALDVFTTVDPMSMRCLDAGASTGGFTDVLLRRGAKHVVAADVGHGQLVDQIRQDRRVSVFEGLNVRYLKPEDIGGEVDLVVADLSFISLRLVIDALAGATRLGGSLMLMVKPQFEVGRDHLNRTGVVSSPELRRSSIEGVVKAAREAGLELCGVARSPLPGQDGNVEFFLWLGKVPTGHQQSVSETEMWDAVDYS